MVAVVAVVTVMAVALSLASERRSSRTPSAADRAADAAALQAWGDAVAPAAFDAGRAIALGIRPDISDFRQGRIAASVWMADMEARAHQFSEAKAAFAAAGSPVALGQAPGLFDEAFSGYLLAAFALHEAGRVEGAEREALITMGAEIGNEGDQVYDRAASRLQAARRAAGLRPDARFPDKGIRP